MRIAGRPAAALLLVMTSVTAPAAARPDGITFKTRTDLVALNVTVTNRAQKHVVGLKADQFVVVEDGVRQPVEFFSAESVPLDLAILIDASASMQGKIAQAREAAVGLATSLRPLDRATVVEFRDVVRIRQPLTSDRVAVAAAIKEIAPRGSTALYDALYIALKDLAKAGRDERTSGKDVRRQAAVVLSDGDDTASLSSYDDVSDLAKRSAVAVYTVSLKSAADLELDQLKAGRAVQHEADYAMRALALDTGGRSFFPKAPSELKGIYDVIAEELGHQYALGYVPLNARRDGEWRRVAVQVLVGDARPRTRPGYFAVADAGARPEAGTQP